MIAGLMSSHRDKALPVVLAAVWNQDRLLLIRRTRPPFSGLWGLLGGKVDYGEHLDEAVVREVAEESGVRARFGELCGVVTESLFDGRGLARHYLLLVCRLTAVTGRVGSSAEGEVRWFGRDALAGLRHEMIPSDQLILQRLVLVRPERHYYRCVMRKRANGYQVVRFT